MKDSVLFARVPKDVHLAARITALKQGRPVARLVEEAVVAYLASVDPQTQRDVDMLAADNHGGA